MNTNTITTTKTTATASAMARAAACYKYPIATSTFFLMPLIRSTHSITQLPRTLLPHSRPQQVPKRAKIAPLRNVPVKKTCAAQSNEVQSPRLDQVAPAGLHTSVEVHARFQTIMGPLLESFSEKDLASTSVSSLACLAYLDWLHKTSVTCRECRTKLELRPRHWIQILCSDGLHRAIRPFVAEIYAQELWKLMSCSALHMLTIHRCVASSCASRSHFSDAAPLNLHFPFVSSERQSHFCSNTLLPLSAAAWDSVVSLLESVEHKGNMLLT